MTETPAEEVREPRPDGPTPEAPRETTPAWIHARDVARALGVVAPLVPLGFFIAGVLATLGALPDATSPAAPGPGPRFVARVGALSYVLLYGLVGWVAGHLVRAVAAALELGASRAEASHAAGRDLIATLGRLAEVLERPAPAPIAGVGVGAAVGPDPVAEIRRAIQEGRWEEASGRIEGFVRDHPGDPEGERLGHHLAEARGQAARGLRSQIAAAREVNDPDRVLELHAAVVALLDADALRALDQEIVRWLMGLIQKRLRAGKVRVDVADLASRVAERFDHTTEGASLRAALPTLRRSAGLCARCGQPYTGIADACPACLAAPPMPPPSTTPPPDSTAPDPDDEPEEWSPTDDVDFPV